MEDTGKTSSGTLYVVATPVGNLDDMTPRAISTLQNVDLILAEDTRHSGNLLKKFAITTPAIACHEHNERQMAGKVIQRLQTGENMALISDAGTPLVSDPGYHLLDLAVKNNIKVSPIPGSCALISALSVSGLPSDQFTFNGFLPAKGQARKKKLEALKNISATQIFYEGPHRLADSISDMNDIFGVDRRACIARELTKIYETIRTSTLSELEQWIKDEPGQCRGEVVILVAGNVEVSEELGEEERVMRVLLEFLSPSQAVQAGVRITGGKKNHLYKLAQALT